MLRQVRQRERGRKRALDRLTNVATFLAAAGQVFQPGPPIDELVVEHVRPGAQTVQTEGGEDAITRLGLRWIPCGQARQVRDELLQRLRRRVSLRVGNQLRQRK